MLTIVCTIFHFPEVTSKSSVNSAKQAWHLFSPQSSLVIIYANGMLASAHNDSQMLLRNIRESKSILCFKKVNYQCFYTFLWQPKQHYGQEVTVISASIIYVPKSKPINVWDLSSSAYIASSITTIFFKFSCEFGAGVAKDLCEISYPGFQSAFICV